MDSAPPPLTAALASADPADRAAAIARLRFRDLKDPAVLAWVLRAARDPTGLPGDPGAADPFHSLFGQELGAARTIADLAAERLYKAGLPGDPATVAAIVDALGADGPAERLPGVVAAALGETRWEDLPGALSALIPALDPYDTPLFAAIVRLPSEVTPLLVELAVNPLRPRLFQELLNHPPSRADLVAGVAGALRDGSRPEADLATVCAVLAAWSEPASARIAAEHRGRLPWLVAIEALEDPGARPALAAWLASPERPEAPAGWWGRVSEILRQRDPLPDFPLAAWLRAAGDDHGLCDAWGVELPGVAEVLEGWVADGGPRGADAARALLRANRHARVVDRIDPAWLEWDERELATAAEADPALPGLLAHLLARLRADPSDVRSAAAALKRLGGAHEAAEIVLAAAEAAPERITAAGRGLERVTRDGVDLDGVEPLVPPDLAERYAAVRPFVRAAPRERA